MRGFSTMWVAILTALAVLVVLYVLVSGGA